MRKQIIRAAIIMRKKKTKREQNDIPHINKQNDYDKTFAENVYLQFRIQ